MSVLTDDMRNRITALFPKYPNKRAITLPALHMVHDELREVSVEAIREIAALLELNPSEVHDTMSFYQFFRTEENPLGKNRVWVCRSLSCMLRGGEELLAHMCETLHVQPGETTADGRITLEFAECLGACEGAPCVLVNEDCVHNLTHEAADQLVAKL